MVREATKSSQKAPSDSTSTSTGSLEGLPEESTIRLHLHNHRLFGRVPRRKHHQTPPPHPQALWKGSQKKAPSDSTTTGSLEGLPEESTIRRHLHNHRLFGRVPRIKPFLTPRRKRWEFPKRNLNDDWTKVLWSDGSKIERFDQISECLASKQRCIQGEAPDAHGETWCWDALRQRLNILTNEKAALQGSAADCRLRIEQEVVINPRCHQVTVPGLATKGEGAREQTVPHPATQSTNGTPSSHTEHQRYPVQPHRAPTVPLSSHTENQRYPVQSHRAPTVPRPATQSTNGTPSGHTEHQRYPVQPHRAPTVPLCSHTENQRYPIQPHRAPTVPRPATQSTNSTPSSHTEHQRYPVQPHRAPTVPRPATQRTREPDEEKS
ncbi:uncharacterized protein LOC116358081 [Oncorhynchus kisutch]|uniref:uncharacterized protein LOC116358081 n=1 Tax=Oncorhynchus kisutch TaxID=8019 RepID=UPI0012DF0968|nr:uncharacterized protein LOC116358081 [Oncorhynchus kisutch]